VVVENKDAYYSHDVDEAPHTVNCYKDINETFLCEFIGDTFIKSVRANENRVNNVKLLFSLLSSFKLEKDQYIYILRFIDMDVYEAAYFQYDEISSLFAEISLDYLYHLKTTTVTHIVQNIKNMELALRFIASQISDREQAYGVDEIRTLLKYHDSKLAQLLDKSQQPMKCDATEGTVAIVTELHKLRLIGKYKIIKGFLTVWRKRK
jgi:hypothetical protein